jgi:predicted GTPase
MSDFPRRTRVVILGAAGRDFHNFNVVYRDDPAAEVVAFTAAQIPGIAQRRYPPALSGPLYPAGIPIVAECELDALVRAQSVDEVVFAYSDVTHAHVMHLASRALAAGADFVLLGPAHTMLKASIPVIAVSAVRTGCGKTQTVRYLSRRLQARGVRVAVIRHPMPYGDLERARVQRFASRADLNAKRINPLATIIRGASPVTLEDPEAVRGKTVLAVDDGPTITHGGMPYGAAFVAAREADAARIVDPRPWAAPALADVYDAYLEWATPAARALRQATPNELRRHRFAAGSMGPKVEAACRFVEATHGIAGIGRLEDAMHIMDGRRGTLVRPD